MARLLDQRHPYISVQTFQIALERYKITVGTTNPLSRNGPLMPDPEKSIQPAYSPAKGMNYVRLRPNFWAPAGAAILALAVFIAYFPSLNGGFIWDDEILLTKNPLVNASGGLHRIWCTTEPIDYWPLTNTTFWLEWRLWEMHLGRLPCHQPDPAHCRIAADLGDFAEIIHTRGFFGGLDLCPASGERGIGGLDCAAEKYPLHAVFPVVDSVVSEGRYAHGNSRCIAPARSHGGPWERDKSFTFILHPSSSHFGTG